VPTVIRPTLEKLDENCVYGSREHRTKVESKFKGVFTRSQRTASLTEYNMSALTDHEIQENHTIHWKEASVIDRQPDRPCTRWIKEAVHIRKEGH